MRVLRAAETALRLVGGCPLRRRADLRALVSDAAARVDAEMVEEGVSAVVDAVVRYQVWVNDGLVPAHNQAMLDRVQRALGDGKDLSEAERCFLVHERVEDLLLRDEYMAGVHDALFEWHGAYANYERDVVKDNPEFFSPLVRQMFGVP